VAEWEEYQHGETVHQKNLSGWVFTILRWRFCSIPELGQERNSTAEPE